MGIMTGTGHDCVRAPPASTAPPSRSTGQTHECLESGARVRSRGVGHVGRWGHGGHLGRPGAAHCHITGHGACACNREPNTPHPRSPMSGLPPHIPIQPPWSRGLRRGGAGRAQGGAQNRLRRVAGVRRIHAPVLWSPAWISAGKHSRNAVVCGLRRCTSLVSLRLGGL